MRSCEAEGYKKEQESANRQASLRTQGGKGGCERKGVERSTGLRKNGGGRESHLIFSLYRSLPPSLCLLCSDVTGWSRGGEASPAGFWPRHSEAELCCVQGLLCWRPEITQVRVHFDIMHPRFWAIDVLPTLQRLFLNTLLLSSKVFWIKHEQCGQNTAIILPMVLYGSIFLFCDLPLYYYYFAFHFKFNSELCQRTS